MSEFEPIENIRDYENLRERLGVTLGDEVYKVVQQLKHQKQENSRLRRVVCLAVRERFPQKAGKKFLEEHRIVNQFGAMNDA